MEPRTVTLEKEKKKKTKKEKKCEGEKEKVETLATVPIPGGMLQAVASFLDRHGFSKTLSAFSSEAQVEVDSSAADTLEAIYSKHVKDKCEIHTDGGSDVLKNKDSQTDIETTKDNVVAPEERYKKKRKRCSDDENMVSNCNIPNMDTGKAPPVDESSQPKEKKKKKNKLLANGSTIEDVEQNEEKLKSGTLENSGLHEKVDTADVPQSLEQSTEVPKHKKKKNKTAASREEDVLEDQGKVSQVNINGLENSKESESVSNGLSCESGQAKEKKKRQKREAPEDSRLVESKHVHFLNSQQYSLDNLDGGNDTVKEEKHDLLKNDSSEHKKSKQKKEKIKRLVEEAKLSLEGSADEETPDKAVVTTVEKRTGGSENGSSQDQSKGIPKLTEVNDNGTGEEKGHLEDSITKTMKKDSKQSEEPKTVNAFRRVNPDEVRFADERLQDNSYWAKGGAGTGYGAKAQEVLEQVRGKDFRHEKTKKKRGSYRGGQIDFQSHSIKFNYSDAE